MEITIIGIFLVLFSCTNAEYYEGLREFYARDPTLDPYYISSDQKFQGVSVTSKDSLDTSGKCAHINGGHFNFYTEICNESNSY